jgi:hypothetical protein
VTGRTLSCLLLMTISAALLGAQSHPAPAFSTPGRDPLTGVPARNTLLQPGRPIPELPRLHDLARHAGTIFSGTVTSVEPTEASTAGEIPAVAVTFHVEHAIRGATATPTFTIREWRGLWNDAPRYLLGQRLSVSLQSARADQHRRRPTWPLSHGLLRPRFAQRTAGCGFRQPASSEDCERAVIRIYPRDYGIQ